MAGLDDTYVAALQHDLYDPGDAWVVGVVRRPTPWFHGEVDDNIEELAPPDDLVQEFKDQVEDRKTRGMCDEEAHNSVWSDVDFDGRYREYLEGSDDAQMALDRLATAVEDGENVVLVCFEDTSKKRCHRTILKEKIRNRTESQGWPG